MRSSIAALFLSTCAFAPAAGWGSEEAPAEPPANAALPDAISIGRDQLELIPYGRDRRNFDALLGAAPGVVRDHAGGADPSEFQLTLEGANVKDPRFGTLGTALLVDFLDSLTIEPFALPAERGFSSGPRLEARLKSGGNQLHGSVFAHYSPFEAARAPQPGSATIAAQTQKTTSLDLGAELGGPIVKDLFWFYAGFAPQLVRGSVDRIIQARTDSGNGTPVIDPISGAPAVKEVGRQTYATSDTAYQYVGKLTARLGEMQSLSLAVFGEISGGSGLSGNLGGSEGTFIHDNQSSSTDLSLHYLARLNGGALVLEVTPYLHRQSGSLGGDPGVAGVQRVSTSALANTPQVTYGFNNSLLSPVLTDFTTPNSQRSAAVAAACALQSDGFDPCPVRNYSIGGLGFLTGSTLQRLGGTFSLSSSFKLAGSHRFQVGVEAFRETLDRSQTFTGGARYIAVGFNGTTTRYNAVAFGSADPARPGQPLLDANGQLLDTAYTGHTAGNSVGFFAEETWAILDRVILFAGMRLDSQQLSPGGLGVTSLVPRLGLSYDFLGQGRSSVHLSLSRYAQSLPLDLGDALLGSATEVLSAVNAQNCKDPKDPRTCSLISGGSGGRNYTLIGGAPIPIDSALAAPRTDEVTAGVRVRALRELTLAFDYVYRVLARGVGFSALDCCLLSNAGSPPPSRSYHGGTLSLARPFSANALLSASYTLSSLRGTYPGLLGSSGGLRPTVVDANYDSFVSRQPGLDNNRAGPLPADAHSSFKLDGAYLQPLAAGFSVSAGAALRADQGAQTSYLAFDAAGAEDVFILPRGIGQQLPWVWQLDLRLGLAKELGPSMRLGLQLDLFNVTNNQAITAVDQAYTFDSVAPVVNGSKADLAYLKTTSGSPVTPNAAFGAPVAYQLPLSARLGARLSF